MLFDAQAKQENLKKRNTVLQRAQSEHTVALEDLQVVE